MAKKDITEKILLSYADVFADCENALIYEGKQILKASELQPAPTESFYRSSNGIHNQFCDISSYQIVHNLIKAQYIIENETHLNSRQVLRKASYQGGAYREQLKENRPVYPVYSMVLDWTRKNSRIPLSLHELLIKHGVSSKSLHLIDDVKLTVLHMSSLSREIRNRFTSDMGFVVDYLNEKSFENRREQKIIHLEALCEMMEALTNDTRFTSLTESLLRKQQKGKEIIMCEYIDMLEAKGEQRGFRKGIQKGVRHGENRAMALLSKLYSLGRYEDARLAVSDQNARHRLYKEFHIK